MAIIKLIKTNSRRHESAKEHWKLTERRCYDLEMENPDLKGQVSLLSAENDLLRIRAEKAEAEVIPGDPRVMPLDRYANKRLLY